MRSALLVIGCSGELGCRRSYDGVVICRACGREAGGRELNVVDNVVVVDYYA